MNHFAKKFLKFVLFFYAAFVLGIFLFQRKLIYLGPKKDRASELQLAEQRKFTEWKFKNEFVGWKKEIPSNSKENCSGLFFHGNYGSAVKRMWMAEVLEKNKSRCRWTLYLYEYPGFGARDGKSSEEFIVSEGRKIAEELKANGSLYLFGESLGTGVASEIAGLESSKVDGVYLITPFDQLASAAAHRYYFLPVKWLLAEDYNSEEWLKKYSGPVAVTLAGQDTTVPPHFGKKLFETYQGPKKLWIQENRGHNNLDHSSEAPQWKELFKFWNLST